MVTFLLVKTRAACLERTIETTLLVAIANDDALSALEIVLGVSVFGVEVVKGVADECLGEGIARSLDALRFFCSFSSCRGSE